MNEQHQGRNLTGDNPVTAGACQVATPATAAVSHNAPPAASGGEQGCDLRQGVTRAGHAVLDQLERMGGGIGGEKSIPILLLEDARKAVAAAIRANPDTGMGRRRIERATMAAALIIRALDSMDETGRTRMSGTVT